MNISKVCVSFLLLFSQICFANVPFKINLKEGKDYRVVEHNSEDVLEFTQNSDKKVHIFAFFSYGCPACKLLSGFIDDWNKRKPSYVELHNVPVVFNKGWKYLAQVYYSIESLNATEKMTPKLFNALQIDKINLLDEKILDSFLEENQIELDKFKSNFNSLSTLKKIELADKLSVDFKIIGTPSYVVYTKDKTYCTDLSMAKGSPNALLQILNHLSSLGNNV